MWLAVVPKSFPQDMSSCPKNILQNPNPANFYFKNPLTPNNDDSVQPITRLKRASTFDCISNTARMASYQCLSPAHSIEDLPKNFEKSNVPVRRRAPGFLSRPVSCTLTPGSKLNLSAKLLGYPSPKIIWEKGIGFALYHICLN